MISNGWPNSGRTILRSLVTKSRLFSHGNETKVSAEDKERYERWRTEIKEWQDFWQD